MGLPLFRRGFSCLVASLNVFAGNLAVSVVLPSPGARRQNVKIRCHGYGKRPRIAERSRSMPVPRWLFCVRISSVGITCGRPLNGVSSGASNE